jgi:RND family efflux transporter MFP subunit
MPPSLVVTEPLQTMVFHDQLTLIGRTQARAESRIVAEVAGVVQEINAPEGRWVQKGQPLVTIDSRRIALVLRAKTAQTKQAKADADFAERQLKRSQDMYDQEVLSESGLDADQTGAIRTIERYNQLEAERKQLELDLEDCTIRAPYDGYTVRFLVEVGEGVSPGTPVYEMVDLAVVKVTVDLPERHFGNVAIGSPVSIQVSGDNPSPVSGTVSGIAPQASEATHTFPVIVAVPNNDGRLGGGMLVRATVSLKRQFESFAVSKDAIIRQAGQTMVYTVVDGKAAPIPVNISSSNGTMVAVQGEGLADGMPVVVRGNERIFPGSPVMTPDAGQGQEGEAPPGQASQGSK